jgi:hypothetical protein
MLARATVVVAALCALALVSAAPAGGAPTAFFISMGCDLPGCTGRCANQSVPLGRCLIDSATRGPLTSSIVSCGATTLTVKKFTNATDCTGPTASQAFALATCMKDEMGSYFEYFCPSVAPPPAPTGATPRAAALGDALHRGFA